MFSARGTISARKPRKSRESGRQYRNHSITTSRLFLVIWFCFQRLAEIYGGETGIRTLDTLRYTRFPSVRLQPLGHLSTIYSLTEPALRKGTRLGGPRYGLLYRFYPRTPLPAQRKSRNRNLVHTRPESASLSIFACFLTHVLRLEFLGLRSAIGSDTLNFGSIRDPDGRKYLRDDLSATANNLRREGNTLPISTRRCTPFPSLRLQPLGLSPWCVTVP